MGGRGSSSAFNNSQPVWVGNVIGTDGVPIDLSKTPLQYDGKDAAVRGKTRKLIEAFENEKYTADHEYNRAIDYQGNIISENEGKRGSVEVDYWALMKADIITHNHPRSDGVLGGTFSAKDIEIFTRYNATTFRATAAEGTYSITKQPNFTENDKDLAFMEHYRLEVDRLKKRCDREHDKLFRDYRSGAINMTQWIKATDAADNKMLVGAHRFLLDHQKQYGYTYTLERR